MRARRRKIWLSAALFFLQATPLIHAEPADWLIPGSHINSEQNTPEYLSNGPALEGDELRGKLLFQSASLLGEKATRLGLSCNSCHPAGHTNAQFFMPGLSDTPGRIDLTNRFWFDGGEDGVFNPMDIPTLRNVAATAPYGTKTIKQTLSEFSHHVITAEFNGPPPTDETLAALTAYMSRLTARTTAATIAAPISFAHYLRLLGAPMDAKNGNRLDHIIYLLREELGRRAAADPQNTLYPMAAQKLREISATHKTNWQAAASQLAQLLARFTS